MSQGFTVKAGALSAGGQQVAGLVSTLESIASDVVQAISGMAGSASGHAGLASALTSAAGNGAKTYHDLGAAYRYVGESLAATASAYDRAEQTLVASISGIGGGR
ncbi:MAG TPA: type VII secretion target [Streptosporangiaceae bacterium]|nr:type VII secretion target [Streptosporangiaceae bacterium]